MPEIEKDIRKTATGLTLSTTLYDNGKVIGEYGGFISSRHPDRLAPAKLWVEPDKRGNGFGEQLMSETVNLGIMLGAKKLVGHVESEHSLRIRAKLFGKSALQFYDDGSSTNDEMTPEIAAELPMTYEQAMQSLRRASSTENDLEDRKIGFDVEVDLSMYAEKHGLQIKIPRN